LKQERVKQNLARLERARANRVIAWEDKIDEDMERVQAFEQAKASIQQTKAEHDYITFVQNERFRKDFAKMRDGATLDDVIQAAVKAEQTHIDTFEAEEEGLEDTIAI
jgi:hypothetical protein